MPAFLSVSVGSNAFNDGNSHILINEIILVEKIH